MDELNIDALISLREEARAIKDWEWSDELRDELDSRNVFVFDAPGGQEVYHLHENYFKNKDKRIETAAMSKRQFVEYRIKRDIAANNNFDAWLTTHGIKHS